MGSESTMRMTRCTIRSLNSVHHTENEFKERLRFPEENTIITTRCKHTDLWTKVILLRCLRDHREEQLDEYETDSDDEESDFEENSELINRSRG